jgi:hypothetical protein
LAATANDEIKDLTNHVDRVLSMEGRRQLGANTPRELAPMLKKKPPTPSVRRAPPGLQRQSPEIFDD